MNQPSLYGLMTMFDNPDDLLAAAHKTYAAGYRKMDAYSPFPIHGLAEAVGYRRRILPWVVLGGGIFGGIAGFALQYWVAVIALPLNIGGRPLNSWPAFIPVTFETTVLCAALSAVLGMLALNGLPRPHHPVFNQPRFAMATRNRFFLCIESADPLFDRQSTGKHLEELSPYGVLPVEN
jgi:Alternative complex III, ActD subunit